MSNQDKKNFHEITKEEFDLFVQAGKTWKDINDLYQQPKWCAYPEALNGIMGCWSLTGLVVTGESFCNNCEEKINH